MYKRCHCGKFFETLTEKRIYCSDKCRPKKNYYIKKKELRKICMTCKEIFITRHSRKIFCSDKCRKSYYYVEKIYFKTCIECDKQFKTRKSFQFYCNQFCYNKAKNKRDYEYIKQIRSKE